MPLELDREEAPVTSPDPTPNVVIDYWHSGYAIDDIVAEFYPMLNRTQIERMIAMAPQRNFVWVSMPPPLIAM